MDKRFGFFSSFTPNKILLSESQHHNINSEQLKECSLLIICPQIRFRNSTETLNQFIGEVDYGLKSINKTISPFLANLLNEDGIAITNKLSDALCGKRRNVLDEHRKGKGVSDVISWMVDIIASEGKSPPENTNNTGLGK